MNAYNIAVVTGRLTKSPEIRYTEAKKAVAYFTLAVNDGKDRDGRSRSQFLDCVAFEKTAELVDQYFSKGDGLTVVGRNTIRTYETKDGERRRVYELIVDAVGFPLSRKERPQEEPAPGDAFDELADDEELPF